MPLLFALLFCLLLPGCSTALYQYPDAERYTAGGALVKSGISALMIDWIEGGVELRCDGGDSLRFSEEANRSPGGEEALRYFLDSDGTVYQIDLVSGTVRVEAYKG